MNASNEQHCFMATLYGVESMRDHVVSLVREVDELLGTAGQPPTHLSVTASGFGRRPLLFVNAWKRLQKTVPADLRAVSVFSFVPDWHSQFRDWIAIADLFCDLACFQFGADLDVIPEARKRIMDFVRSWLVRLQPAYGIAFIRGGDHGAGGYGIGLPTAPSAFSGPEYEEVGNISRWAYVGMHDQVWRHGLLRDVYPYNLLNQAQLESDIDGRSLGAWIRAGRTRGALEAWPADLTLWTVPVERISAIQKVLARSGVLFARPHPG